MSAVSLVVESSLALFVDELPPPDPSSRRSIGDTATIQLSLRSGGSVNKYYVSYKLWGSPSEVPTTRLSRGKGCQLSAMADRWGQRLYVGAGSAVFLLQRGLGTRLPIVGNRWGLREGAHPQKEPDCTSETCGKLVGTKVGLPWAGGWSWVTRLDFARRS